MVEAIGVYSIRSFWDLHIEMLLESIEVYTTFEPQAFD